MTVDRRQWLLGGGAVVIVAIGVWLQMTPAATVPVAATPPARARGRAAADMAAAGPPPPVALAVLESNRQEPVETSRNPFRFQPKVAPVPAGPVLPARPVNLTPPTPGPPPGPPAPTPIPLKFIGLVEKADGLKVAVLTDGRVTLYGREGDIIDGRYKIVKIGVESIELTYADGRGRQTIRLTGQ